MRTRSFATDLLLTTLAAAALSLFALWLFEAGDGAIPRRNVYFNSDTDRVVANLIDRNSNYVRLNVHPLFGLVCIVFQKIFGATADLRLEFAIWSAFQGALLGACIYLTCRFWGGSRSTALAATLLAGASAAFVFWSPMPETHLLGGISVLMIAMLWRLRLAVVELGMIRSAIMFTIGASMIVTNVVAWLLTQIRFERLYLRQWRPFLSENLADIPRVFAYGLAGLGLLTIAATAQDFILRNESVPPLLRLWHETKYVSLSRGSWLDLANVLALVHGDKAWFSIANLAMLVAVCWAGARNGPKLLFLALWPMFGMLLHSIYDRAHAFLFSPNYLPAGIVVVGLASGRQWPRAGPMLLAVVAVVVAAINIDGYLAKRAQIAPQTDPPSYYAPLRQPHPVPTSNIVRPANPPIGFDE